MLGIAAFGMGALKCDKLPTQFETGHLPQHALDVCLFHIHQGFVVANVNRADGTAGNVGFAGNRAHNVAGTNAVFAPDIQREAHHSGFVFARRTMGSAATVRREASFAARATFTVVIPFCQFAHILDGALGFSGAQQADGSRGNGGQVVTGFDKLGEIGKLGVQIGFTHGAAQQHGEAFVTFCRHLGGCGQGGTRNGLAGEGFDGFQPAAFTGRDQGDGNAFVSGAPGAPDAMDIIFGVAGNVVIDNM